MKENLTDAERSQEYIYDSVYRLMNIRKEFSQTALLQSNLRGEPGTSIRLETGEAQWSC